MEFPELQEEAISPWSNDYDDNPSFDKVVESLIKAFEERKTRLVKNSLDFYAKQINDTVSKLTKTVAALGAQVQAQQAMLRTILEERSTIVALLSQLDFTSNPEGESSGTKAEPTRTTTKIF